MALFDALSEPKKLWRFENANHNSLPLEHWHLWWREVMHFIDHSGV
jgi:dipeptidyl aminopeptidase/acylaminoacyl peptidase